MSKLKTIEKRDKKVLEIDDVCERLWCSIRTAYRYLSKYRRDWPGWVIHWLRWKPSNNRSNKLEWVKKYALKKKYNGFWPTLLQESLIEELWRDEASIKVETLRLKMIERWRRVPRKPSQKVKRHKRSRRSKKWVMVQFDGSYHVWLENGEEACLLLSVDDATSELMRGVFTKGESLWDMIKYRKGYFERYGKPQSIYLDCHATYKVNHEQDQFDEEMKTRFQRGMQKLGIEIIYSKCPQWKGRVERSFRTHQDRLIKKMRLEWIKTNEEANKYFDEEYRKDHNTRFGVKAEEEWDMHMPLTDRERKEFKRYFAHESKRQLKHDGTISYNNKIYQVKKGSRLQRGREIEVKESIDWEVRLFSGKEELEVDRVKNRIK